MYGVAWVIIQDFYTYSETINSSDLHNKPSKETPNFFDH